MTQHHDLQKAISLHQSGQLDRAREIYLSFLEKNSNNADANNLLGALYINTKKPDQAIIYISRAIEIKPGFFSYYINLGAALEMLGNFLDAEKAYKKALSLSPGNAKIMYSLGNCYHKQNRLDDAVLFYRQSIQADGHSAVAHFNLGNALFAQEKFDEAEKSYQNSLRLEPGNPDIHFGLGITYIKKMELDKAAASLQESLEINPRNAKAHFRLGTVFHALKKTKDAENSFRKAVELQPNHVQAINCLGEILLLEDEDISLECFQKAIEIDPGFVGGWINIINYYEINNKLDKAREFLDKALKLHSDPPVLLIILQAIIMRREGKFESALEVLTSSPPPQDIREAVRYHSELGKLYDRAGKYDLAYSHFTESHENYQQLPAFHEVDKNRYLQVLREYRENITYAWASPSPEPADKNAFHEPVFVVGFPRSGTTLTGQILDSHPRLQLMEEFDSITKIEMELRQSGIFPGGFADMTPTQVQELQAKYFDKVNGFMKLEKDKILIDKLPLNIVKIGLICKIFPKSKIVLVIRHPFDACLSNYMQNYALNDPMANFFTMKDAVNLYNEVMGLWGLYRENMQLDYHLIRYEDIVENIESEAKKMLDFIGVEWDDQVLSFYNRSLDRRIRTPSYHQVTEPIYKRSMYRWKGYREYFREHAPLLAPYVAEFGYPDIDTE